MLSEELRATLDFENWFHNDGSVTINQLSTFLRDRLMLEYWPIDMRKYGIHLSNIAY